MGGGIIETNGGNVMKKRILSVIFAALMLSACAFGFAACDNATAGQQDNEVEQGSNGDNAQGGGTENDPQGGDEPAVRTTVTEEEWNAALRMDGVRNVTVTECATRSEIGGYSMVLKMDSNQWYWKYAYLDTQNEWNESYYEILVSLEIEELFDVVESFAQCYPANYYEKFGSGQWGMFETTVSLYEIIPVMLLATLLGSVQMPYEQFTYNEQLCQYEAKGIVFHVLADNGSMNLEYFEEVVIQFEDGKIINYKSKFGGDGYLSDDIWSISMSFTDYGTTSVTLPEVSAE